MKRHQVMFGLRGIALALVCMSAASAMALPSYQGSTDVSVGLAAFRQKPNKNSDAGYDWVWVPNAKRTRNGHLFTSDGKIKAYSYRALFFGGRCEPIFAFNPAAEYYQANVADLPIRSKEMCKDAYQEADYQELLDAKRNAQAARRDEASKKLRSQVYASLKSLFGMPLGKKLDDETYKRLDDHKNRYAFDAENGLAGFERCIAFVTPRSRKVYKIEALRENCTIEDSASLAKQLEGRYPGLRFNMSEDKSEKKWSYSTGGTDDEFVRKLRLVLKNGQARIVLEDKRGKSVADLESEGKCVRCRGTGLAMIKSVCSSCHGTKKEPCSFCLGTKTVDCSECANSVNRKKCRKCRGKGKVKCNWCKTGYTDTECIRCKNGKEEHSGDCPACKGTGKIK